MFIPGCPLRCLGFTHRGYHMRNTNKGWWWEWSFLFYSTHNSSWKIMVREREGERERERETERVTGREGDDCLQLSKCGLCVWHLCFWGFLQNRDLKTTDDLWHSIFFGHLKHLLCCYREPITWPDINSIWQSPVCCCHGACVPELLMCGGFLKLSGGAYAGFYAHHQR